GAGGRCQCRGRCVHRLHCRCGDVYRRHRSRWCDRCIIVSGCGGNGPGSDAEHMPQPFGDDGVRPYLANTVSSNSVVRGHYRSGGFCLL
ncbi:unnamed protein product, partial [Ectocarpus sp. 12 AP-2014]